jgi:hypothetical protein
MVAVAIAALDFAAIRAALTYPEFELLLLGALPMVNILIAGGLIGQQCPGSRPFLLGFESFGAMAVAVCVAFVSVFDDVPLRPRMAPLLAHIEGSIGRGRLFILIPAFCSAWMAILGLPQVFSL